MGQNKLKRSREGLTDLSFETSDCAIHLIGERMTLNIPFTRDTIDVMATIENSTTSELVAFIGECLAEQSHDGLATAALIFLRETNSYKNMRNVASHYLWTFLYGKSGRVLARGVGAARHWNEEMIKTLWSGHRHLFNIQQYHTKSRLHYLMTHGIDDHTIRALLKTETTHVAHGGEVIAVSPSSGTT